MYWTNGNWNQAKPLEPSGAFEAQEPHKGPGLEVLELLPVACVIVKFQSSCMSSGLLPLSLSEGGTLYADRPAERKLPSIN